MNDQRTMLLSHYGILIQIWHIFLILAFFALNSCVVIKQSPLVFKSPTSEVFFQTHKTQVSDLPSHLPLIHQLALKRLNQYRKAAGLPTLKYKSVLSKMAQLHANYIKINCNLGNPYTGHTESPFLPGYSHLGHQAAKRSGLSYGRRDPLDAFEDLMSGAFHRIQFLRRNISSVGYGFTFDERCGGTLFVTQGKRLKSNIPRFILFPPMNFRDSLTHFYGENPDPRPHNRSLPTGYPVTIHMKNDDAIMLRKVEVSFTDQYGKQIKFWLRYAKHPSIKTHDSKSRKAIESHFDTIFILPKKPLNSGTWYHVKVHLVFAIQFYVLKWSFQTRSNRTWHIKPNKSPSETLSSTVNSLSFALTHANSGDTIHLKQGTYPVNTTYQIDKDIILRGSNKNNTILLNSKEVTNVFSIKYQSRPIFYLFTYKGKSPFLLALEKSNVDIKHINIYTTYEYPYLISLYGNAILYIESTTIKKSGSHLVFFVSGPSFSSFESSSLYLGEGNKFIVPNMPISWLPYPEPKSFVKGLGHVEEITYRSKTVQNEEKTKP